MNFVFSNKKSFFLLGNLVLYNSLSQKFNTKLYNSSSDNKYKVFSWGSGIYGQLGTGKEVTSQPIPTVVYESETEPAIKVFASFDSSALLTSKGNLYVWGKTRDGTLGPDNGNSYNIVSPSLLQCQDKIEGNIINCSMSKEHGGVATDKGYVYLWGVDSFGKLGICNKTKDSNYRSHKPQMMNEMFKFNQLKSTDDQPFKQVSCGYNHTLCLTNKGSVYSFGYGKQGALGLNNFETVNTPKQVAELKDIIKIVTGNAYSLALTKEGKAYSWGTNDYGQLGHGQKADMLRVNKPQEIQFRNSKIIDIEAGEDHSAIITDNGEAYVFGFGGDGRLGNKEKINMLSPNLVNIKEKVRKISCGGNHTAFLAESGNLYVCGAGRFGELGRGEQIESQVRQFNEPLLVIHFQQTAEKVIDIACGSSHCIALTEKM